MLKKGMAGEKKKKSWNWWGNPNIPESSHENLKKIAVNPQLAQAINDIFSILRANTPEKTAEKLIEWVETEVNLKEGKGLIEKISDTKPWLNFWFLADENFSLNELERLNILEFNFLENTNPLKTGIEKVLVKYIKNQFKKGLSKELSKSFSDRVQYNTNSISELLSAIKLFSDNQINNPKEKKEFENFSKNFSITFQNLKSELENATPPITLDELNDKSFSQWDESQRKTFDTMFSKLALDRLKARVQQAKKLTQDIGESFWKTFSLSTLFSKFPWKYEDLYSLAQEKYPESAHVLENLEEEFAWTEEEKTEAEREAILKKIEEEYWKIYLAEVQEKDPEMAQALKFLYEHNFDFSKLNEQEDLRNYFLEQLAEIRYEEMKKSNALEIFGGDSAELKKFFKSLLDFSSDEIEINGVKLKVEKSLIEGENIKLKDLWEFSIFNNFPLQIKVSGLKEAGFSLEDQEKINQLFNGDFEGDALELKGKKVGKLLLFFLFGQPDNLDALDPDSEEARKFDSFMNEINKQNEITKEKRKLNEPDNPEENNTPEENREDTPEERNKKFLEAWKSIKGENRETPDGGFVPWALFYFSPYESKLPPFNGANHRIKAEITNVNWENGTFRVKFSGSELSIKDDGKESPIEYYFKDFEENFANNEHYLAKPFKILPWRKNLEETMKDMKKNGICGENIFGNAKLEDWKITLTDLDEKGKETKEEVKYFWTAGNTEDKDRVLYEIQQNPNNTITVKSSNFLDSEGNTKKRKKTMSYPDFLIFLNEKKLSPKTEQMAEREKKAIYDVESKKKRKLKRTSIHSLIYSVKNIWKTFNSKLDEYQKEQDEKCLDRLVSDVGIYKGLNKAFGWIAPSLRDSFTTLHDEAISGIEKKNWKEIEKRITLFKGVEFADIFESGKDPASGERMALLDAKLGKRGTLKNLLINRECVINNDKLRPIVAAAMISNLKEGKGLYRGMPEYDNQGLWIQSLFWPEHYQRYLQYKRNIQADIDSGAEDVDQLKDLLAKSEINYIVYNIQNSHGKDKYFWSVSDNNQQALKKIYSVEFASQLNNAAEEMTWQGAIENAYNKSKKCNSFNVAEEEFKKCIKSSRIEVWLWYLKRMGELAKKKEQRTIVASSMSYVTLSGIINKYADKGTMDWFDGLARSFMLPTAFFADKPFHQRYAWHLLDQVPVVPKFSDAMRTKDLTEAQFSNTSSKVPYGDLLKEIWSWRSTNAKTIDQYFLSLKTKDHPWDPILEKIKEVLWEKSPDNLDPNWSGKPKITGHYGLNATPATIDHNKSYDKAGFKGKDQDEKNDKATFRKDIDAQLRNEERNGATPEFFLRQFVTWFNNDGFSDANASENISWIRAIKDIKSKETFSKIKFTDGNYTPPLDIFTDSGYTKEDANDLIWLLFKGKIIKQGSCQPPDEIDKVLNFFKEYFTSHFDEISSDEILKKVFWKSNLESDESKSWKLIPWREYDNYIGKSEYIIDNNDDPEIPAWGTRSPEEQKKIQKNWKKTNYRSDLFMNRSLLELAKNLKRIGATNVPKLTGKTPWSISSEGVR